MNREEKLIQLAELLEELYPTVHVDIQKSCGTFDEPTMDFVSVYVDAHDPDTDDKIGNAMVYFFCDKNFEPYAHIFLN